MPILLLSFYILDWYQLRLKSAEVIPHLLILNFLTRQKVLAGSSNCISMDWLTGEAFFLFFPFCVFFTASLFYRLLVFTVSLFYKLLVLHLFVLHPFFNLSNEAGKTGWIRTIPFCCDVGVFDYQLAGLRTEFIRASLLPLSDILYRIKV